MPRFHFSLRGIDAEKSKEILNSSSKTEDDEDQSFGSAAWTASCDLCSTKCNR